jgi:hypothetical protein
MSRASFLLLTCANPNFLLPTSANPEPFLGGTIGLLTESSPSANLGGGSRASLTLMPCEFVNLLLLETHGIQGYIGYISRLFSQRRLKYLRTFHSRAEARTI